MAILKAKIALYHLLLSYKFSVSEKTQSKLKLTNNAFVQEPADGIYLKVEKRMWNLKKWNLWKKSDWSYLHTYESLCSAFM